MKFPAKIRRYWIASVVAVFLLLLISFVFGTSLKTVFFVMFFILIGSFSTFYFNYVQPPIKFELIKLGVILSAVAYGFVPALIIAIVATLGSKILIGRIDEKLPLSVFVMVLVAAGASLFITPENLVVGGIILVGVYNVSLFVLSMMLGGDLAWNVPYEGSDFIINFALFSQLAPILFVIL